jgi:hypothetical protein
MEKPKRVSRVALLIEMQNATLVHMRNIRDFIDTCIDAEIVETKSYYFKRVTMFGPKELRFWKATGRISTVANPKRFTRYDT